MSKKYIAVLAICLAIGLGFGLSPANAQNTAQDIPDVNGIYEVPGKPKLKVRVFVHNPRDAKNQAGVCNLTDPDSQAVVDPAGWKLPTTKNWTYNLNYSSLPFGITRSNLDTFSSEAFAKWNVAAGNKIAFVPGTSTTTNRKGYDGKNIVAWGSAPGSALAVSYVWYYPSTGEAVETDIIMNRKFAWGWTPFTLTACANPNKYDAQDILTHEIGHWVGLDDEYTQEYAYNTMYGYGAKGEIIKDTLTTGDSAAAYDLYN